MVVTTVGTVRIAWIVDGLEEVRSYRPEDVRTTNLQCEQHPGFLDRLTVREGQVVQWVHIRNMLKDHEMSMLTNR